MKPNTLLITLLLAYAPLFARADILAGPITNNANGHVYYLLSQNTWTESEAKAHTLGGHLVTINDAAENQWVFDTFSAYGGINRSLWIGLRDVNQAGDWRWVSGEPVTYLNWAFGGPNYIGEELYVYMYPAGFPMPAVQWNNYYNNTNAEGPLNGVIEVDPLQIDCSPRRASATATVVNGFVVGATVTDPGCGYTNAPVVLIQGGGGTGATATAVVENGVVTGIIINTAGSGYTSAPNVRIASPPFLPTVSIAVSKVKVTQNVVLGRNYVLESSSDLATWTPTGPPFTAESESIVSEFDVDATGRYFRIRQVP